jgi:thymidylate synthase (FAD)
VKIIEPSFSFQLAGEPLTEDKGVHLLRWVESNARISHRSEDSQTDDSWKRFIQAVVIDRGDWSVTEHATLTASICTDRGITHELVRHRLFSFTQESTRFVRYKETDQLSFIKPEVFTESMDRGWSDSVARAEWTYFSMLRNGAKPQEARSVLPNALAATISMTGNLRNWRHFFLMRTSKETHPDMRRITIPMLSEIQKRIPLLYADIVPEERQIENLKKAR